MVETEAELIEDIKIFLKAAEREKEDCANKDDIEGRYFAAGQISALKLVLEMIEKKQED